MVDFMNHLRHMMRLKMKYSTIASYVSSTVSLATAASAAVLSAGGASTALVASLAAGSAFANDMFGIFKFKDRVAAYQDGLALIEKSEVRYIRSRSGAIHKGQIPNDTLTTEGAMLYEEIIGALRLVEKALANQIPTIEEIERATGKTLDNINALKLEKVQLVLTGTDNPPKAQVLVIKGHPILDAISHDPADGSQAKRVDEGKKIEITGTNKIGKTAITVMNEHGSTNSMNVIVVSPIIAKEGGTELKKDKNGSYTLALQAAAGAGNAKTITIDSASPVETIGSDMESNRANAVINLNTPLAKATKTYTITGVKSGAKSITLKNVYGQTEKIKITVK
jgi:hypothetical protein